MDMAMGAGGAGEPLWTVDDLARFLQLKPYTVRVWVRIRRDDIPVIKTGRLIRFDPQLIKKWLKKYER